MSLFIGIIINSTEMKNPLLINCFCAHHTVYSLCYNFCLPLFLADDTDFALECHTAFLVGQDTLDDILWNSTGKYYNAYSTTEEDFAEELFFEDLRVNLCDYPKYHKEERGECYGGSPTNPGAIMTDTFYAQVTI